MPFSYLHKIHSKACCELQTVLSINVPTEFPDTSIIKFWSVIFIKYCLGFCSYRAAVFPLSFPTQHLLAGSQLFLYITRNGPILSSLTKWKMILFQPLYPDRHKHKKYFLNALLSTVNKIWTAYITFTTLSSQLLENLEQTINSTSFFLSLQSIPN